MIAHKHLFGFVGKPHRRNVILVRHIGGEFPEQHNDVFAAFAKRRQRNLNGSQPVVEVFAEFTFFHQPDQIAVGGGNDAHIGFLDFGGAHFDIFAVFQYPQQSHLGGQGEFGHFVQEKRSLVGHFEIAAPAGNGSGKRALFVPEQFAVDGAFGDGAAVDGKIGAVFAGRKMMDDFGNNFLTRSTFAGNQHGDVGGGYTDGPSNGLLQFGRLPDDAEALFDALNVHLL